MIVFLGDNPGLEDLDGVMLSLARYEHNTADFILKVLKIKVYTYSMETIYLSLRAQVAVGTFFMKSPVC